MRCEKRFSVLSLELTQIEFVLAIISRVQHDEALCSPLALKAIRLLVHRFELLSLILSTRVLGARRLEKLKSSDRVGAAHLIQSLHVVHAAATTITPLLLRWNSCRVTFSSSLNLP